MSEDAAPTSGPEAEPEGPAPSGFEPEEARLRPWFGVLARVEDQIRAADSKAAFVATLHSFLVGPMAGNAAGIRQIVATFDPSAYVLLWMFAGLYVSLLMVTMGLAGLVVLPRFRGAGEAPSRLFFGRIAREFGDEPGRFVAAIGALSDRQWIEEVGRYIVDASSIAATKHRFARWATTVGVATILAWVALVLVLMTAGQVEAP